MVDRPLPRLEQGIPPGWLPHAPQRPISSAPGSLTARLPAFTAADVTGDWLDQHTSQGPAALRARVFQYFQASPSSTLPERLAVAAQAALGQVLSHPGDRSAALDLLSADALITLALLAQAEQAPDELEQFAGLVLRATRSPA